MGNHTIPYIFINNVETKHKIVKGQTINYAELHFNSVLHFYYYKIIFFSIVIDQIVYLLIVT